MVVSDVQATFVGAVAGENPIEDQLYGAVVSLAMVCELFNGA